MADTSTKPNYKKTLNLPKTDFPMRANLAQNEPQSEKRWNAMGLYRRVNESRAGAEPFVFHDGPPYTSGNIHVGHLLNKVLKDIVVRSRSMAGFRCPYVPGWDCHGLPIEHRVMQELVSKGKVEKLNTLSEDDRRMAIRRECRRYAEKYMKLQARQMQRLLTLADYDDPYLTMNPGYEQAVLEVFADLVDRGLVERALKSVHWSIANETALADAELEYYDREDLSVYVDFEAADRDAVARAFGVELDETPSFMIWTTTPWTLAANLAIAVHPEFTYALARIDGSLTVLAKDLVARVTETAKSENVEVLAETRGENLVGLRYRHPLVDPLRGEGAAQQLMTYHGRSLQDADYVTLEDGTGLVHTAPGHGEEDYQTGKREDLPIYCPVRADGTYDDTVPEWLRGMSIWDANEQVTDRLRETGHLFHSHRFTHSYPHDWRSKTPVIFRATDQWFVAVDRDFETDGSRGTLRKRALGAAAGDIRFIPEWGRNRMRGMLESRPDWCLSRQRSWGLPIPVFYNHAENDEPLVTPDSVRAVARVIGEKGSDAWFTESVDELLKHYDPGKDEHAPAWMKAGAGAKPELRKGYDIFDVWFESGSSWNAVLRRRNLGYPADLYLEGSDQHRGWFQLSLLPAVGATGVSPFKAVLTHGFMVDKDGRKMSKSLGNALDVDDLLKDFGADVCRWWVSSLAFENDIKVDLDFFKAAGESYRKVRNTLRFLLSNLSDFDAGGNGSAEGDGAMGDRVDLNAIPKSSLDAWALATAAKLQHDVRQAYERYEFRKAHQALYDFCNDTMSAVYLAAVKDRLYCDAPDSPRRRRTQTVLRDIADGLARLLAPIVPHTADAAFRTLHGGDESCVHLATVFDLDFTADGDWPAAIDARDRVLKALEEAKGRGIENPLDAAVIVPDPGGVLRKFADDFADLCGVSQVDLDPTAEELVVNDLRNAAECDRCWRSTPDVEPRSDGGSLCARCAEAVGV